MQPRENSTLATHLLGLPKGPSEAACLRGSCGRAYYAAFGVIRDVLDATAIPVSSTGAAHGEIIKHLHRSTDADVRAIGSGLDNLRVLRNTADYEVGSRTRTFNKTDAHCAVALSRAIVRDIDVCLSRSSRLSIPR